MAVVAVNNVPEPGSAEAAEGIKADLMGCVACVCWFGCPAFERPTSHPAHAPTPPPIHLHPYRLFGQVGAGAREVHLKPGASTAFVVLADPQDLAEAIRALDWSEYAGRKLRVARSGKRTFG